MITTWSGGKVVAQDATLFDAPRASPFSCREVQEDSSTRRLQLRKNAVDKMGNDTNRTRVPIISDQGTRRRTKEFVEAISW